MSQAVITEQLLLLNYRTARFPLIQAMHNYHWNSVGNLINWILLRNLHVDEIR